MTATSDLKLKTRRAWLFEDAEKYGLYIRTYSPGDGVTRYRFFRRERCKLCLDYPGFDGVGNLCKSCDGKSLLPPSNDYFGPANGIYTALGLKEAETFVRGYNERSGR